VDAAAGTNAAPQAANSRKDSTMNTLDPDMLTQVTGGTSSTNAALTQSLTTIQTALGNLANNNNNQSNPLLPVMMAMALSRR
jgi:hypothetical protein